jgi:hypothetical protein
VASIAVTGSTRYQNLRTLDEHFADLAREGDPSSDPLVLPGAVLRQAVSERGC